MILSFNRLIFTFRIANEKQEITRTVKRSLRPCKHTFNFPMGGSECHDLTKKNLTSHHSPAHQSPRTHQNIIDAGFYFNRRLAGAHRLGRSRFGIKSRNFRNGEENFRYKHTHEKRRKKDKSIYPLDLLLAQYTGRGQKFFFCPGR